MNVIFPGKINLTYHIPFTSRLGSYNSDVKSTIAKIKYTYMVPNKICQSPYSLRQFLLALNFFITY